MTRQRYSVMESLNRILRLFLGSPVPTDAPETVPGEIRSEDEALSDLAELFANSLPNETLTIPIAMQIAMENAGFATGSPSEMLLYNFSGDLSLATGTYRIYNRWGDTFTFQEVFLSVSEAPTDASIIVDINKNGSSIFSSNPTIPAGSLTGSSVAFSDDEYAPGDFLTFDIDQVGSGTYGSNMVVHVVVK